MANEPSAAPPACRSRSKVSRGGALTVALALTSAACGGGYQAPALELAVDEAALHSDNGLSSNGLSTNGLSTNGLSTNGLSTNGLSTSAFTTWFASSPVLNWMLMKYMVRCALPSGASLSYTYSGVSSTWAGELGLAPSWGSGGAFPVAEQELVSACLAAHANKFLLPVNISVRGYFTDGSAIPVSSSEQAAFPNEEGCFFGNLFNGAGVFSAYSVNSPMVQAGKTSLRACAADGGRLGDCAPMSATGASCQSLCSRASGSSNFAFTSCSWNGVSYRPISTRLANADIATCGDGVCQASETCYDKSAKTGCQADCGKCK